MLVMKLAEDIGVWLNGVIIMLGVVIRIPEGDINVPDILGWCLFGF